MTELINNMDRMTTCPATIKESVKVWEETLKPMAASEEMTGEFRVPKPIIFVKKVKKIFFRGASASNGLRYRE